MKRSFYLKPYVVNRRQFLLQPFASTTYYKAQGKTLKGVVVVTQKIWQDGEVETTKKFISANDFYVGSSRVTETTELFIYPQLPDLTKPTPRQENVQKWMSNMPAWERLLLKPTEGRITVGFHNGQGAASKKELYESTNILESFDILVMAECYNGNMFDQIKQLDKIAELKGKNKMGTGLTLFINKAKVEADIMWTTEMSKTINQKIEGIIINIKDKTQTHATQN